MPRGPRFGKYDPNSDERPARGLIIDAFDEELRERDDIIYGRKKGLPRKEWPSAQIRAIEDYSEDPADWLADTCMTQTEVALRLGRALIVSGTAHAKVVVTLAGNELTRREKPRFPVHRFLTERLHFTRLRGRKDSWEGAYGIEGHKHSLVLLDRDRFEGHLTTKLTGNQRLIAFVSRGHTITTRSSGEHKWVRGAIARAATWDAGHRDVLAVCVPRSKQFLKVVKECRDREGIRRLRLNLLLVDRQSGDVSGLENFAATR